MEEANIDFEKNPLLKEFFKNPEKHFTSKQYIDALEGFDSAL